MDAIRERVGDDSDADASDAEDSADDSEEEEEAPSKKKPSQSIKSRKILKPKRKLMQPANQDSPKVKSPGPAKRQKTAAKESPKKVIEKKSLSKKPSKQSKAAADEDMESQEEAQIDTVVGTKRLHPLNQSQPSSQSQPPNRRAMKKADGSEKIVVGQARPASQSAKKVSTKPAVFKLGKWNPNTEIVETEIEKHGPSAEPEYGTGHRNNTRNVIRAINTDNIALLRQCKKDTQKVFSLNRPWAEDADGLSPIQLVALKQSKALLQEFFPNFPQQKGGIQGQNTYAQQITALY